MIVLDASVAAKWFLPEPGYLEARELLSTERQMVAPGLVRLEVAGAILRGFRENRLTEGEARACYEQWERMLSDGIIVLIPNDELHELAIRLAFEIRHSVQDCLYLAAGKLMKASVVTADRRLVERGGKIIRNVRLLGGGDVN